jgi:hypothetical protein
MLLCIILSTNLSKASENCMGEIISSNLCLAPHVDMSRINKASKVLEAAKTYALKLKPYGLVKITSGYRTPKGQKDKQASGNQAGASSGPNMSAHIYGTALDLQILGDKKLRKVTCEALISAMPIIGSGGGVIHEGCGGGSCDVHLDDNWGKRHWHGQMVMYESSNNCSDFPVLKKINSGKRQACILIDQEKKESDKNTKCIFSLVKMKNFGAR